MSGQLRMFGLTTSEGFSSATSLQASAAGRTLCGLLAGLTTPTSGQVAAPVSPSRLPAPKLAGTIRATFGLRGSSCSKSAALQSSLVSKLMQRLDTAGSIVFAMTWNRKTTPSGRVVSRLRASARTTSANGSTSWPTPKVATGDYQYSSGDHDKIVLNLSGVAKLAEWRTPKAQNATGTGPSRVGNKVDLQTQAGWATPLGPAPHDSENTAGRVRDRSVFKSTADQAGMASWPTPTSLSPATENYNEAGDSCNLRKMRQLVSGAPATGSPVATAKRGQLNQAHSRWLMGYPPAWDACAAMVTRSSRSSRKSSSSRISKPEGSE